MCVAALFTEQGKVDLLTTHRFFEDKVLVVSNGVTARAKFEAFWSGEAVWLPVIGAHDAVAIWCKTGNGGSAPVTGAGHTARGRMRGMPGAPKRWEFTRGKKMVTGTRRLLAEEEVGNWGLGSQRRVEELVGDSATRA
jgi:hypothetical protein